MTNAELAVYLNAELGLVDKAAVTSHVVRQWVLWDLLPKAAGRGRGRGQGLTWERSERDLRRARQLATWRAYGVRRENALIVHAYVAWGYRDWERVREALATELQLASAALRKRVTTSLQFGSFRHDISQTRKRAFRTQLGPLDHRLKETQFELSPELYALAGQAAFEPPLIQMDISASINEYVSRAFPTFSPLVSLLGPSFFALLEGIFANEDETDKAAMPAIANCSEKDLRTARFLINQLYKIFFPAYRSSDRPHQAKHLFKTIDTIGPQITVGHWRIVGLASAVRIIQAGTFTQL